MNRAGRISNGQKTHEEMLNIPGHKGNPNQNHFFYLTPVTMAISQTQTTHVGKDVWKRNPHTLRWECKLV
jgi:hypothetical protein